MKVYNRLMESISTMGGGSLGQEIDLEALLKDIQDYTVEENFSGPSMLTIRFQKNGAAYTIYRTGKFQIRGAKDKEALREAVNEFEEVLGKLDLSIEGFEQNTSVFIEDLDDDIDLEKLSVILGFENTEYEPEQFPALIYRPSFADATALVFSTGSLIIAGTTEEQEAREVVRELEDKLP
jgi:transcription initiation factor TFIID TATA-box-binding protein